VQNFGSLSDMVPSYAILSEIVTKISYPVVTHFKSILKSIMSLS